MRVRATITTVLLAAVVAAGATACSSSSTPAAKPTTTAPAPTDTAAPGADAEDALAKCVAALEANPSITAPPPECASLSRGDYLTAVQAANRAARDRLASAIASASAAAGQ